VPGSLCFYTVAVKRIRGRKLQAIRDQMMRDNPLCVECEKQGIVRVWTQSDHIVALHNGGEESTANRQGLCHEHHAQKTARDMGITHKPKRKVGPDGWPES
jgi:5-methylcytosine-specific restriction enzyme A